VLLKDRVPIFFNLGSYGHYIHWVLNNFTARGLHNHPGLPFNADGGSHSQFERPRPGPFWSKWVNSTTHAHHPFFCIHYGDPATGMDEDALMTEAVSKCNKIIAIKYTQDMQLVAANNWLQKTRNKRKDWFGISELNDVTEISQQREILSYKLFYDAPDIYHFESENIKTIDLYDLLYNFEDLLTSTVEFLDTELTAPISTIIDNHESMLALQSNLNKNNVVTEFLSNFVNRIDCALPDNCSIIDEAYIQYYLREKLQLDLRCNEIGDTFPNTAAELWKYT